MYTRGAVGGNEERTYGEERKKETMNSFVKNRRPQTPQGKPGELLVVAYGAARSTKATNKLVYHQLGVWCLKTIRPKPTKKNQTTPGREREAHAHFSASLA